MLFLPCARIGSENRVGLVRFGEELLAAFITLWHGEVPLRLFREVRGLDDPSFTNSHP